MNSLRKIAERALFVFVFFGAIVLFNIYTDTIRHKQLEKMTREFAYEIAKDGQLTTEEYYMFLDGVGAMDSSVSVELSHTSYELTPYYEGKSAAEISAYFGERNILNEKNVPVEAVDYPKQDFIYALQDKTNASVLASISGSEYIPLPEDTVAGAASYTAVCPSQRVYCGEKLCTVVRVFENGIVYYREADEVTVGFIGTGDYELTLDGEPTGAFVSIVSYPTTQTCDNGHETVLTPSSIELFETTGAYAPCAFCALEPEYVTASVSDITAELGTAVEDLPVILTVTYMDGHTEDLTPDDKRLHFSYDSAYCGVQDVRVSFINYEGEVFTCTLQGGSCSICGAVCENRNLADYRRFSFCEQCMDNMPLFYGTTFTQADYISNSEIVTVLASGQPYFLNRGDYIKIKLSSPYTETPLSLYTLGKTAPVVEGEEVRTDGFRD